MTMPHADQKAAFGTRFWAGGRAIVNGQDSAKFLSGGSYSVDVQCTTY